MKETEDYTTCKLIFPVGTTECHVRETIAKHTSNFSIANFYPEREVGCNTIAFAVVDVPHKILPDLYRDGDIKGLEVMMTFNGPPKSCGSCDSC